MKDTKRDFVVDFDRSLEGHDYQIADLFSLMCLEKGFTFFISKINESKWSEL